MREENGSDICPHTRIIKITNNVYTNFFALQKKYMPNSYAMQKAVYLSIGYCMTLHKNYLL